MTATWVLAIATSVLALTSLVAVFTWRENRRREYEKNIATRILEDARKEFAPKQELSGLKDTLTGIGLAAVGVVILALANRVIEKKEPREAGQGSAP